MLCIRVRRSNLGGLCLNSVLYQRERLIPCEAGNIQSKKAVKTKSWEKRDCFLNGSNTNWGVEGGGWGVERQCIDPEGFAVGMVQWGFF